MDYFIVAALVLLSGLFSGLTLGLLSLDKSELERKISLGNADAIKVYAVRRRGNLLLCTLLLGNVAVNSSLAIFLGNIASGVMAGFIATGLIVVFGEIIPQATFSRYALKIGAKTAWIVKIFIVLFFPITWPIAWILDKVLGAEMATVYSRKELMKIVEEHENSDHSDVDEDEERIILGALSYSGIKVESVMTPRTVVFGLNVKTKLDSKVLHEIKAAGFTRVPVFEGTIDTVVGVLNVKDLITVDNGTHLSEVYRKDKKIVVSREMLLDTLLDTFIRSKTHIAFVENEYQGLDGIVTLEDVIEEVLRLEIVDETDTVADMQAQARKMSR